MAALCGWHARRVRGKGGAALWIRGAGCPAAAALAAPPRRPAAADGDGGPPHSARH
eukprot:gene15806-50134_t